MPFEITGIALVIITFHKTHGTIVAKAAMDLARDQPPTPALHHMPTATHEAKLGLRGGTTLPQAPPNCSRKRATSAKMARGEEKRMKHWPRAGNG